jgi:hypothetical protein
MLFSVAGCEIVIAVCDVIKDRSGLHYRYKNDVRPGSLPINLV